eukprot:TRINITY_DN32181_c0_g1_i1.p3 TRINITY_DN32181_c0_g1~~TRINITY_DN32181_c0_g1_i1.p3  ORF type:complete len:123 (-),score=72.24 TRINITY_DN32181_c0_g1_i1:139-474(-)
MPDYDDAKSNGHFADHGYLRVKKGKRKQFINGWNATNCAYYRKQDECLEYWVAEDPDDEDVVQMYCKFVSKEAFDSMPVEEDKAALNALRGPFMQLIDGKPVTTFAGIVYD